MLLRAVALSLAAALSISAVPALYYLIWLQLFYFLLAMLASVAFALAGWIVRCLRRGVGAAPFERGEGGIE